MNAVYTLQSIHIQAQDRLQNSSPQSLASINPECSRGYCFFGRLHHLGISGGSSMRPGSSLLLSTLLV